MGTLYNPLFRANLLKASRSFAYSERHMEETTFSFLTGHTNCVQNAMPTASSVTHTEDEKNQAGKCEDMETLMILG